jgi:hypothetical protein
LAGRDGEELEAGLGREREEDGDAVLLVEQGEDIVSQAAFWLDEEAIQEISGRGWDRLNRGKAEGKENREIGEIRENGFEL